MRLSERVANDAHTGRFVVGEVQLVQGRLGTDQRDATAGDDALFDGRPGRRYGVLDAVLLLLELDLGGRTHLDDRHAP